MSRLVKIMTATAIAAAGLVMGVSAPALAWHVVDSCVDSDWVITNPADANNGKNAYVKFSDGTTTSILSGGSIVAPDNVSKAYITWADSEDTAKAYRPKGCHPETTTTTTAPCGPAEGETPCVGSTTTSSVPPPCGPAAGEVPCETATTVLTCPPDSGLVNGVCVPAATLPPNPTTTTIAPTTTAPGVTTTTVSVTTTQPPTTTVPPKLPTTGSTTAPLVMTAFGLLGGGILISTIVRRRRLS